MVFSFPPSPRIRWRPQLREALKKSGGKYILGEGFTYADIVMAVAMQPVKPVGPPYSKQAGAHALVDLLPGNMCKGAAAGDLGGEYGADCSCMQEAPTLPARSR